MANLQAMENIRLSKREVWKRVGTKGNVFFVRQSYHYQKRLSLCDRRQITVTRLDENDAGSEFARCKGRCGHDGKKRCCQVTASGTLLKKLFKLRDVLHSSECSKSIERLMGCITLIRRRQCCCCSRITSKSNGYVVVTIYFQVIRSK